MGYNILSGNIEEQNVDIIVNASNSIGWMGGLLGKYVKLSGVAESLHYASKGMIEKEAKKEVRGKRYKKGDVFITSAANLPAGMIIHAITMNYPGQKSDIKTIEKLIPVILKKCRELGAKTIAIPMLGAGTGRIPPETVFSIYDKLFADVDDIEIFVIQK